MSDPFLDAPWKTPDFREERDRAMFAYAMYFDHAQVSAAIAAGRLGTHEMPQYWRLSDDVSFRDGSASGLTAATLVNERRKTVVIAYRGQDNALDEPARRALNIDGDILGQIGLPGPKADTPKRQLADLQTAGARLLGHDAWDRQFAEALDYAKRVRDVYGPRGYSIEVVGHDIGGSHAELVGQTFGWPGRTFDAHGAANVARSNGYRAWLDSNDVKPAGIPGYDPDNLTADNFLNYATRFHEASNATGPHLGQTRTVSAFAGREGVKDHLTWLASTADSVLSELPLVGELGYRGARAPGAIVKEALQGVAQHQALQAVDADMRGSMERMLRVFDVAVRDNAIPTFGQDAPEPGRAGPVAHSAPTREAPRAPDTRQQPARVLADHPSHPDFAAFERIHAWVRGTGQWDEAASRNVTAALYREQSGDPLVRQVDFVTGGVGRDGAQNVFAVYAPFGDREPRFHAHVDGRVASQQPARQNLEQAEQVRLSAVQQAPQQEVSVQADQHRAMQRTL